MILRWIYNSWRLFWGIFWFIAIGVVLSLVVGFFVLQLDSTKEMLAQRAENYFSENFNGELRIGRLDGLVPFRFEVTDVRIIYYGTEDEAIEADTVFQSDSIILGLDIWDLIRERISVNYFNMENPRIRFTPVGEDAYAFNRVFETSQPRRADDAAAPELPLIFAPSVVVSSGSVVVDRFINAPQGRFNLPEPFEIRNIDLQMFLDINSTQRFLDIEMLSFLIPGLKSDYYFLSGQFYNDERYLEFNRVLLSAGNTRLSTTFEIDGVDLTQPGLADQLASAGYRLILESASVTPSDYDDLMPELTGYTSPLHLEILAGGTLAELDVNRFNLSYGSSDLFFYGQLTHLLEPEKTGYDVILDYVRIRDPDIRQIQQLNGLAFSDWDSLTTRGHVTGSFSNIEGELTIEPPRGMVRLFGNASFRNGFDYAVGLQVDSLNLAHFPSLTINNSSVNLTANIRGSGTEIKTASGSWGIYVRNSFFEQYDVPLLDAELNFSEGIFRPELFVTEGMGTARLTAMIDANPADPATSLEAVISGFNLRNLIRTDHIPPTDLNTIIRADLSGMQADRVTGELHFDVNESMVDDQVIDNQKVSISFREGAMGRRHLMVDSEILNLQAEGEIYPTELSGFYRYWKNETEQRLRERRWYADTTAVQVLTAPEYKRPVSVTLKGNLKNFNRISRLWEAFPDMETDTDFSVMISASKDLLELNGKVDSRSYRLDSLNATGAEITFDAYLRPSQVRYDYLGINLRSEIEHIDPMSIDIGGLSMAIRANDDRWRFDTGIRMIGEEFAFSSGADLVVSDSNIVVLMEEFYLGSDRYLWQNPRDIRLELDNDRRLIIDDLEIASSDGLIRLNGVFSNLDADSMMYSLDEVGLGAISSLIGGRVGFDGKLSATVTTKMLTTSPTIEGEIFVDALHINNRLVGDVNFQSIFNPVNRHFDSRLSITTDEVKYAEYRKANNGVGFDLHLEGFLVPPDPSNPADTVFYFDADLREIDTWIVPLIVEDIFDVVEGRSSGRGVLYATLEDYYFNALFQLDRVYARPVFLNTDYTLTGPIELDRITGVFIDNVHISDGRQGNGNLYGIVDLNDFQREKYLNISMTLDRLQFLNNRFSPDQPFFGNVTGTGEVNIIGMNTSPYLRTTQTIVVTSDSRLSIPLLDETTFEEQSRLIRYVSSFDEAFRPRDDRLQEVAGDDDERGFMEIFQFDLQFVAPQNTTVQLVFDPVTNEILTARGNGRIRITLEDQTLQMFGRFDVSDGDYLFVGGDIFSRRFTLREGGSITWEGDPANARVDITAAYRSRPNIAPIDPSIPDDTPQRIPVDLVLVIKGNLDSIENEFYFEFPNATDASEYTTLLSIINNEEQKLIQATSLLFTGAFIQTGATGTDPGAFGRDFQGRAAGQAGLSLLSNQITALLNSNLNSLNLDVDLNLTGLDQADLGVALRLFDDRLILRGGVYRDVYDESAEVSIGDLGVRFRINRALSVELFHRKDQRLALQQTETQVESVNGIGFEARVQFNTWRELGNRIWGSIRKIFVSSGERSEEVAASAQ